MPMVVTVVMFRLPRRTGSNQSLRVRMSAL